MARRKKGDLSTEDQKIELALETISDDPDAEDEIELDADVVETEGLDLDSEVEIEVKPKPKRRAPRRRRKAEPGAETALIANSVTSPGPAKIGNSRVGSELVSEPVSSPLPPIREDMTIAEASIEKSMDAMVKQWSAVKEISGTICTNLEKVTGMIQQLPENYTEALQGVIKPPTPRSAIVTKVALSASIAAIVLSVLSLTLSQSTRDTLLNKETPKLSASSDARFRRFENASLAPLTDPKSGAFSGSDAPLNLPKGEMAHPELPKPRRLEKFSANRKEGSAHGRPLPSGLLSGKTQLFPAKPIAKVTTHGRK